MPYTPVRTTERTIHSYLTKYLSELYYWDVVITEMVCHIYVTLFTCVLLHIKLYLHVYCYTSNCIYMCTVTHRIAFTCVLLHIKLYLLISLFCWPSWLVVIVWYLALSMPITTSMVSSNPAQ
jgi:hypothetical protein